MGNEEGYRLFFASLISWLGGKARRWPIADYHFRMCHPTYPRAWTGDCVSETCGVMGHPWLASRPVSPSRATASQATASQATASRAANTDAEGEGEESDVTIPVTQPKNYEEMAFMMVPRLK